MTVHNQAVNGTAFPLRLWLRSKAARYLQRCASSGGGAVQSTYDDFLAAVATYQQQVRSVQLPAFEVNNRGQTTFFASEIR